MAYTLLDLSNNNHVYDFKKVKATGVVGVWLKVSEGATFADQDWAGYARRARAAGLRVGGYHYARPSGPDAKAEAQWFCKLLGKIQRRDLRPVLDLEVNDGARNLEGWSREWNAEVWKLSGTLPLFYSYPYFIRNMKATGPIGAGLWLASYGPNDGQRWPYMVPKPWLKAVCHQYTSNGSVKGITGRVDMNYAAKLRPLLAHPILGLL